MKRIALIAVMCAFIAAPASADPWEVVPIVNGDFEDGGGSLTGWHKTDIQLVGSANHWAKFDNPGGTDQAGKLWQLFDTPAGTTAFKLDFDFKGQFHDAPADSDTTIDSLFVAFMQADEDGISPLWDFQGQVYSTNVTTGWTHVTAFWNFGGVVSGDLSPNSKLRFTWDRNDDKLFSSGIDNVVVSAIPVPGAVLLGMLGLSVAGVKLRKRA